jgi:two-component system nitrate/nitrite response regulator NarL
VSADGTARALSVVVADPHAPTRAGIAMALGGGGFEVVAEAATAEAALEAAFRACPDFCLIDADLDGAFVATQLMASEIPGTSVVILAATVDDERLFAALRAGAQGYLLKDMDAGRLPHALRGVTAGEAALPRALVARLIEELRGRSRRRASAPIDELGVVLTDREWDVAEMLRVGRSTKEIAGQLAISPVTVRRHVSELLRKLEAPDRASAVRMLDSADVQD